MPGVTSMANRVEGLNNIRLSFGFKGFGVRERESVVQIKIQEMFFACVYTLYFCTAMPLTKIL